MDYKIDYYNILGVKRDSSKSSIKKAYKSLALEYHPDINKSRDAEKKFKLINEAYSVLSDDEKKREYDALRSRYVENNSIVKKSSSTRVSRRSRAKRRKSNISRYVDIAMGLEEDYGLFSGLVGLAFNKSPRKRGGGRGSVLNTSRHGKGRHRHRHGR